ncbi:FtsK/SpoIIIE domain-containing protein [Curtobacterium sp. DN_7.5]|uniref:FtsK/SpoIIIE domain-containing protein n=1 Tax=Curtobacterium sp. DN_7.5 TaxID=3049047 RepID=UPI001F588011|nr:FtsK/SpoIIIE domain-containing protein [Curtobacterium sp. DN_7.5]
MTLRLSLQDPSRRAPHATFVVDATDVTSVAEVAAGLGVDAAAIAPGADPGAALAEVGILNGSTLPVRAPSDLPPGRPRLEVVGGPFSGETVPLPLDGPLRIGSSGAMELCVADPWLRPHHATISLDHGDPAATPSGAIPVGAGPLRAVLTVIDDATGVAVNGRDVTGSTDIVPADVVQIGSSVFRIGIEPYPDADLAQDEVGMRGFNRTSRIMPPATPPTVVLPGDQPDDVDKTPMPWLSAVIPVVLGVTMAIVFARPIMLMMAAASPVMVVGTFLTQRSRAKKKGVKTFEEWRQDIADTRVRIAGLVKEQRLDSWYRSVDPVVVRDIATRPLARLWERRKRDADALHVRVGVAEVPLAANFQGGSSRHTGAHHVGVAPAPVSVDLGAGVVGVAGPADVTRALVRSMLAAVAALRSPRDTRIVVVCGDDAAPEWAWTQWLPQTQQAEDGALALIGNTDDSRRERLRDLAALVQVRSRAGSAVSAGDFDTDVVVVVDGARDYRTLPGMVQVLEQGARVGVHVVALDTDRARLPEESRTVIAVDPDDRSLARLESDAAYHASVLLDGLSVPTAERIARSLCSIRHVSGVGDEGMLPTSVRYVDLLGVDLDDAAPIVARWQRAPRRTHVVVGASADGEFAIDIAADGPHALVAGTTGSGKSEFLQALVVSLAMANRPDALNFVLVDYKGASAFADCSRLPHTVGMVTNLDARETERALTSLDAELKRRETALRVPELNVKDVDAAWAKDPDAAARNGLARLMIVIDEFAELKTEHPDFIDGLVRIARVGRSLGVHLVLATQRPSGVITPEMQSNINLRVALRVTDRADSTDVLGSPEAALISQSTPGRGFVRAGLGALPSGFQTARVAGIRQGVQRVQRQLPKVAAVDWEGLAYPPRFPVKRHAAAPVDHDDTDLRALVDVVTRATEAMGIPKNASPWLMPLPALLPLTQVAGGTGAPTTITLGIEDVPGQQTQRPLVWDLEAGTHLLFLGAALSGRTTALRTVLAQTVERMSPADLHLYVIDHGNGGLLPLAQAPHTGAVVTPLEPSRLPRLMDRLVAELARRQAVLSQAAVGTIVEQRRTAASDADRLPYIVVGVDGWDRATSSMQPEDLLPIRDQMTRVLREGPAAGIRVAVTGDRTVSSDKIAGFISEQYVLPMRDTNDYRSAGVMVRELPESVPAGRVFFGPTVREAQLAVLGQDASAEAQTAALRGTVETARVRWTEQTDSTDATDAADTTDARGTAGPRPFRVDALPPRISLADSQDLPVAARSNPTGPTIGVGGDELARITLDWPAAGGFQVVGERGTGRSTVLTAIAHQLVWTGEPVIAVATKDSVFTAWAREVGVPLLADPMGFMDLAPALGRYDDPSGPVTVLVDDAELVANTPLENSLMGEKARFVFVVATNPDAAAKTFSGPYGEVRRTQEGLLLSPTSALMGTQLFGQKVPKWMVGRQPAGGGALHRRGEWTQVQVPDPAA